MTLGNHIAAAIAAALLIATTGNVGAQETPPTIVPEPQPVPENPLPTPEFQLPEVPEVPTLELPDVPGGEAVVDVVPQEILVSLTEAGAGQRLADRYGLTLVSETLLPSIGETIARFRLPPQVEPLDLVDLIGREPDAVAVQLNYRYLTANSETLVPQHSTEQLNLTAAHELATGRGITVAVVDTPVDADHPALVGRVDVVSNLSGLAGGPGHAHGTAVAGIIAAANTMLAVSPDARILAIPAFKPNADDPDVGESNTGRLILALDHAIQAGVDVMNLSFSGTYDALVARLIAEAQQRGIMVVAAAGNGGPHAGPAYPAALAGVIAVTAIDRDDRQYIHANRGDYIAVAAPGVDVLSLAPQGAVAFNTGTSIAAAHISGVIALLRERHPSADGENLLAALLATCADLGPTGHDPDFGAGRADAHAALAALSQTLASD